MDDLDRIMDDALVRDAHRAVIEEARSYVVLGIKVDGTPVMGRWVLGGFPDLCAIARLLELEQGVLLARADASLMSEDEKDEEEGEGEIEQGEGE